jgi:hypothetical protein
MRRLLAAVLVVLASCTAESSTSDPVAVPADREALPVAHDNEIMALAPHGDRLFAATDQWEYDGPSPAGQVLVKESPAGPWEVFERTESLRVQAIESFPVPGDGDHSLLVTQAVVDGRSQILWLLDDERSFTGSYVLPSTGVDVRSFGAHEDGGVWSVYAGAEPTGVVRGTWSPSERTLVFDPVPELSVAAPAAAGQRSQKVTGFADCGGALYASINTKLYRRNDGDLAAGTPRWSLVYEAPAVGAHNSGLRGLTCVDHDGAPALLVSTEGTGDVHRFDDLPDGPATLRPTLELSPLAAIRRMLAARGTDVPETGTGSIGYVIAAYNDFETVTLDGAERQLFGFEWGYLGECPHGRTCGPTAFDTVTFDAAACLAVRTDGASPTYALRCLSGPDFTPSGEVTNPIRGGQAFVSIRTIKPSPFGDDRLYYGGYDCNFHPADGTAWIATSPVDAIRPEEGS